jgi:hypothetical protein
MGRPAGRARSAAAESVCSLTKPSLGAIGQAGGRNQCFQPGQCGRLELEIKDNVKYRDRSRGITASVAASRPAHKERAKPAGRGLANAWVPLKLVVGISQQIHTRSRMWAPVEY